MEHRYGGPDLPSSHDRLRETTACRTCESEIGPRDRRLTWRVRDGADVFEYHYCSDECLQAARDRHRQ